MTDTSKREELIERIKAVRDDGYLSATYLGNEHVGDLMGDILAVFEQAHTPTAHECTWACWVDRYGQDHHIPTDDEREALEDMIWGALEPRLEDVINLDLNVPADNAVFAILVGQVVDAVAAGFRGTVQDAPTDAQVLAALNARELSVRERSGSARHFNPALDLSYFSDGNVQDMRAALRAAYEEGKKR